MPAPCKKSKIGQISRLFADIRSPPKHGGSLVVETGFPTSVIDLIVKNRDRLKKKPSTKKTNVASEEWEPIAFPSSPTASSDSFSCSASSSPSADPVVSAPEIDNSKPPPSGKEIPPLVANEVECVASSGVVRCGGTFMIAVQLLFMVILAFATKKLAVGITISTFLLFFLEFVILRVLCSLKPCPEGRKSLNFFIESILFFVRPRRWLITETVSDLSEICQSSIEEIELAEIDFDSVSSERRWGICLTQDDQSRIEEIQLAEPGFRRWNSVTNLEWRPETNYYLNERRWRTGSSRYNQDRGKEIQCPKPDSGLSSPKRRWENDSIKNGKARNLEIELVEAGLDFGATRRKGKSDGGQVENKEIIVERDSDLTSRGRRIEIQRVEPTSLGLLSRENRWGAASKKGKNSEKCEEIVGSEPLRNKKTRSKSKKMLMKLVPKKFHRTKKEDGQENQLDLSSEVFVCLSEEKAARGEEQEQCQQGETVADERWDETEEGENGINGCIDTDADLVGGNGRRTAGNYMCIIMVLTILIGLVQGRFMALFCTMMLCLLLKSVPTVKRILKIT